MSREILTALAISLALTLVLEIGFFFLAGKALAAKSNKKDLLLVAAVNIVTNPVVVLLYWMSVYAALNRIIVIVLLEAFAVSTEGYYYKKYGRGFKRPYLFSVAANVFSFGIGALLQRFI